MEFLTAMLLLKTEEPLGVLQELITLHHINAVNKNTKLLKIVNGSTAKRHSMMKIL